MPSNFDEKNAIVFWGQYPGNFETKFFPLRFEGISYNSVFEDLKFKISEGYDQNWCFPESAQLAVSAKLRQLAGQTQDNFNFGPSLLKF